MIFPAQKLLQKQPKIILRLPSWTNTEVICVEGDHMLRRICYRNRNTGKETLFDSANDTFGVFVFAGYEPNTSLVKELVNLDPHGYVITDKSRQTSCQGIYAAGDVCQKNLRQVVTAVEMVLPPLRSWKNMRRHAGKNRYPCKTGG